MKAEYFDKKFDENEVDIIDDLDLSMLKRPTLSLGSEMERVYNIKKAKAKVLKDMQAFIESVRRQSLEDITDLDEGLSRLRMIRATVYEDLNQIQHEYLIIQGLDWIMEHGCAPAGIQWYWNPRQTGNSTEPDLRGVFNGKVIISAEATTSEKPQGTIDKRMRKTLEKLNEMEGSKFYFVRTPAMGKRAKTKVNTGNWCISVVMPNG